MWLCVLFSAQARLCTRCSHNASIVRSCTTARSTYRSSYIPNAIPRRFRSSTRIRRTTRVRWHATQSTTDAKYDEQPTTGNICNILNIIYIILIVFIVVLVTFRHRLLRMLQNPFRHLYKKLLYRNNIYICRLCLMHCVLNVHSLLIIL